MKKGEKLKNFLKHPGVWLWAFYAALAFFGAACIIVAVLWNGENPVAYSLMPSRQFCLATAYMPRLRPQRRW